MIDELHATDVALIADARIEPSTGLTVLTGETGAGKTALLGALKLLVGERADAQMVRSGADALVVEGRVFLGADDMDGMVVRRRVGADGRGRVEVDGALASVHELQERVGSTVDLCGQHEHQQLLSVPTHVAMLDAWAGDAVSGAASEYAAALDEARQAAAELERVRSLVSDSASRLEDAQFALARIDEVSPSSEELAELEEMLPRATHAEALIQAAEGARMALSGDDDGASAASLVSAAARLLRDAERHDASLGTLADSLEASLAEIEDAAGTLRRYRDSVDFDPRELNRMQERMSALQGIMRSFGPEMEDVLARREQAREIVEASQDSSQLLARANRSLDEAEARLARAADALDDARRAAAPGFARAIGEQMARLEMGSAQIEVGIERQDRASWGPSGPSHVELLYSPGAGVPSRPLKRIASGGEISRVALAAKVVLGATDSVDTLVFDEVDAGVGGATAVSLAQLIRDLAATHQVIVVTHLAQVAVAADKHYVVSREERPGDVPETLIREVSGEARVAEIARMLSGDATEASLAHAREMLGEGIG